MPLSLSATDRTRWIGIAGWLAVLLSGALALWLAVRLVWALVPHGAPLPGVPARSAEAAVPTDSIAKWHLFGQAPVAASGRGSPASTLALVLRGTFAGADPQDGVAVISDAGNGERVFRVGQDVVPGVRLASVHADHVVLSRDGREETLRLPRDTRLAPADVVRPTPATVRGGQSPASPSASRKPLPTTVRAPADWRQTVDRLRQNPDELMRRVQVVPVLSDGKLSGVRLSTGTDVALLEQIGLRQGDVVTAVNGVPVDSVERGRQIMDGLAASSAVRVTVLRNGKPAEVTVGLR